MTKSNSELRKMAAKRLASRLVRDHLGESRGKTSAVTDAAKAKPSNGEPIVCVVHGRQTARKIVSRALASKLDAPVHRYSSCEDALRYTEHYNTFVVYNNFGKRMNGARGVERIRTARPGALIIGVTSVPGFRQKFRTSGADDTVLLSGNEVGELASKISRFYGDPKSGPGGR